MGFSLDDYVDVAERLVKFYEQHPEGSVTTVDWRIVDSQAGQFVFAHARAHRTPDDPLPGDGFAWEPLPGKTPYTKDSELMNAQTAAWGRAIVATGILASKKIASKQEVQARQANGSDKSAEAASGARKLPERYADWLRRAIQGYNKNELKDDAQWEQLLGSASSMEANEQLVKSLEAALVENGGDPKMVRDRFKAVQAEKKATA